MEEIKNEHKECAACKIEEHSEKTANSRFFSPASSHNIAAALKRLFLRVYKPVFSLLLLFIVFVAVVLIADATDILFENGRLDINHIDVSQNTEVSVNLKNTEAGGRNYALVSAGSSGGIGIGKFSVYDATSGASRLTIDPNGRVGIATISPAYAFQVGAGIGGKSVNLSNIFFVNDNLGRVGIGTSVPNGTMELKGTGDQTLRISSLNNSAARIEFYRNKSVSWRIDTSPGGNLRFRQSQDDFDTLDTRMVLESSGQLGIRASNPAYALQTGIGIDGRSVNLSNVLFVNGSSGKVTIAGELQTIGINIINITTAGSWITTPTSLLNATDGNDNTSTTWGIAAPGTGGIIQLNLSSVRRGIIYSKLGLRTEWSGISVYQYVYISSDGINYQYVGGGGTSSTSETMFYSGTPFWGRYIRFVIIGWDDGESTSNAYARLYEVYLKANE